MKRFLLLLAVPCGFLAVLIWMGIDAGRTTPGRAAAGGQLMTDSGSGRGTPDGVRPQPGVAPRDLSSVLQTARSDAESLRPVRSWYRNGRRPPVLARSLTEMPRGVLRGFQRGQRVTLPLPEGGTFSGVVRTAVESEPGLDVLGGRIVSPRPGFFHFEQKDDLLHARLRFTDDATVMLIFPVGPGSHAWVLENREQTDCSGAMNDATDQIGGLFNTGVIQFPVGLDPWSLQSFPGAAGVILLDFNGHTVSNTVWNTENTDGEDIVVEAYHKFEISDPDYRPDYIFEIFNRCKEDFAPFNLNVTTKQSVFDAAPAGRRQRVLITPTNNWYLDPKGGVAKRGSFTWSSDTPCWVWNGGIQWSLPETVSHEAGHALGLSHSGYDTETTSLDTYYGGHGIWAPIMGNSFEFERPFTHWDNGSYAGATNDEDQTGIIAATGSGTNNVGFRADDRGDTQGSATVVSANASGVIHTSGRIEQNGDKDVYRFNMPAGTFDIAAESHTPGPNAYLRLTLRNSSYAAIKSFNSDGAQPATTTHTAASAATYYLEVTNTSRPASGSVQGFPAYAAIGSYVLEITEPGGDDERPVIASISNGPLVFGTSTMEIAVIITDNKAVRMDTLNNGDLVITKGGSTWTPTILSASTDSTEGAKKVTAKFRFTPPGGYWDTADAGTYTITFKSSAVGDTNGNANGSALTKNITVPATDANLPFVTPPNPWPSTVDGATSYLLGLHYQDIDTAFDLSSFDSGDIEVRDPEGTVLPVAYVGKLVNNYNRNVLVTYRVTPPGGFWDEDETGTYPVKVLAGQVSLATGATMASVSLGGFVHRAVLFERNMNSNPGFTLDPGWSYGNPTGGGGSSSGFGADPDTAHTGTNVLGNNLAGDYAANTPVRRAASPVFATTGYQKLSVNYWMWTNTWDAFGVEYRVGTGAWKSLLTDDTNVSEYWEEITRSLPSECDNQPAVQLRWTFGPTGNSGTMGGWNLDDIRVLADEPYAPGRVTLSWTPAGKFTLTEGGASRSYLIKLDQDPGGAPVTVQLSSSQGGAGLLHPASVTIDSTNWSTGRSVSISAPENQIVDGTRVVVLRHTLTSANPHFSGLVGPSLSAVVSDDDAPIIRSQPQDRTLPAGSSTSVSITTWTVTGTLAYQWYSGESGDTSRPFNNATGVSMNLVVSSSPRSVWVRAVRTVSAFVTYTEDSQTAVIAPLTGYPAWKHDLLSHGYTQPQLDAPDFDGLDPEIDHLTHLMEYALGGQPYTQDAALLPRLILAPDGPHFLFRRARSDVDYTIQLSDDMVTWIDFVTNPGAVNAAVDQDVPLPESLSSTRFARLNVRR